MKRTWVILCCLFLCGGLFWIFPLFHIVRNDDAATAQRVSDFNAAKVAKTFWSERLIPSLKRAPDAVTVLSAFGADPQLARSRFGRKVGVSRTNLFVLRGSGTIVATDKKGVGVVLQGEAKEADVFLQTGLLFGNTVRDATALLDASTFADSRQFNEVSTELNRIIEAQIIPMLKDKAAAGRHIDFAGCVEIPDEAKVIRPLTIIPLNVHIE
jgi:predicted lipoprotein